MHRRSTHVALVIVVSVLCAVSVPERAAAAGPWQAQIIDAETGQPLEGVVVLFVWFKMTRTLGGPSAGPHDAVEVVTGPDGRFKIPARRHFTLNPLQYIEGPEVTIFKPRYGEWRVREGIRPEWEEKELHTGDILAKRDIVLNLLPLKTPEERRRFITYFRGGSGPIPAGRTLRLQEAMEMEWNDLGIHRY